MKNKMVSEPFGESDQDFGIMLPVEQMAITLFDSQQQFNAKTNTVFNNGGKCKMMKCFVLWMSENLEYSSKFV